MYVERKTINQTVKTYIVFWRLAICTGVRKKNAVGRGRAYLKTLDPHLNTLLKSSHFHPLTSYVNQYNQFEFVTRGRGGVVKEGSKWEKVNSRVESRPRVYFKEKSSRMIITHHFPLEKRASERISRWKSLAYKWWGVNYRGIWQSHRCHHQRCAGGLTQQGKLRSTCRIMHLS